MKRFFGMMMAAMALSPCGVQAQGVLLPDYATAGQGMATARDLTTAIGGMRKAIGDKSIAIQSVVSGNGAHAALEFWAKPLPPAVHSGEVEYVTVIEGSATVIYGGTLTSPREVMPGLLQGDAIVGGQIRDLHPGDVLLIPSGMPHWFGPGKDGIAMLGIKFAPPSAKKAP